MKIPVRGGSCCGLGERDGTAESGKAMFEQPGIGGGERSQVHFGHVFRRQAVDLGLRAVRLRRSQRIRSVRAYHRREGDGHEAQARVDRRLQVLVRGQCHPGVQVFLQAGGPLPARPELDGLLHALVSQRRWRIPRVCRISNVVAAPDCGTSSLDRSELLGRVQGHSG